MSRSKWEYKASSEDEEASSDKESESSKSEDESESEDEAGSESEEDVKISKHHKQARVPERRQPARRGSAAVINLRERSESEGRKSTYGLSNTVLQY